MWAVCQWCMASSNVSLMLQLFLIIIATQLGLETKIWDLDLISDLILDFIARTWDVYVPLFHLCNNKVMILCFQLVPLPPSDKKKSMNAALSKLNNVELYGSETFFMFLSAISVTALQLFIFWRHSAASPCHKDLSTTSSNFCVNLCDFLLAGSSSDDGVLPPDTDGPLCWPPQEGRGAALHWSSGWAPTEGTHIHRYTSVCDLI